MNHTPTPPVKATPDSCATVAAVPTQASERLIGLDALRGFALWGVFLVNAITFSQPLDEVLMPPTPVEGVGFDFDLLGWQIFDGLLMTKFVSLFSLLFGIGLALQSDRAERKRLPFGQIYRRRLMILGFMGLIHGCLLFEGDILLVYSIVGTMLFLFRWLKPNYMVLMSVGFFLLALLLAVAWAWLDLERALTSIPSEETQSQTDLVSVVVNRPFNYLAWLILSSFMSFNARVIAFFFLGAAIMKAGLISHERISFQRKIALILLPAGLLLEFAGNFAATSFDQSETMIRVAESLSAEIGSVCLALGYGAALLWLVHAGLLKWMDKAFAAVGRMALTNYLMQSVLMNLLFMGFGFGLYGQLNVLQVMGLITLLFAGQIVFSLVWLSRFKMGPMESLWRSLTYRGVVAT